MDKKSKLRIVKEKNLKPNPNRCSRKELSDAEISEVDGGLSPYMSKKATTTVFKRII